MSTNDQNDEIGPSDRARRLAEFSYADFTSIINRLGADRTCNSCGAEKWYTPADEHGKPVMVEMPIFDSEDESIQLYVPRVCTRCANTRFFNVGWLLDGVPKEGEGDEQ